MTEHCSVNYNRQFTIRLLQVEIVLPMLNIVQMLSDQLFEGKTVMVAESTTAYIHTFFMSVFCNRVVQVGFRWLVARAVVPSESISRRYIYVSRSARV